nr:hypothetical protein CFP56_33541 [Quercus suber]
MNSRLLKACVVIGLSSCNMLHILVQLSKTRTWGAYARIVFLSACAAASGVRRHSAITDAYLGSLSKWLVFAVQLSVKVMSTLPEAELGCAIGDRELKVGAEWLRVGAPAHLYFPSTLSSWNPPLE